MTDPSLVRFRAVVAGALAHLESRRQEINDLNVFPVADGDTGDNMALTLRAVLDELDRLAEHEPGALDEIGRAQIVESVARAALLGARGNSGVILSQLIRRRARGDHPLRRMRCGAPGDRPAEARGIPAAGAGDAPRARVVDLPLLHELRRHRHRP